jgi:hypothetical protein
MNNYVKHAWQEFKAAGWLDENDNFKDEMQEMICRHVIKLLDVFDDEGHSGTSAPYAISLFKNLASFEPIAPLTGEDWEWTDVAEQSSGPLWQNKRCSHVFKYNDGAYDIDGIVFYDIIKGENGEEYKSYYTCKESRVPVTFPYTPKTEYKERVE